MSHQDCNDPAMVSDDSVVVASSSSSSPGFTNNKELKRLDEIQSSSLSNDSNDGGPDDDDDDDEIDDYDCDIHQRKDPAHIIQRSESVIKSPSKLAAPTPVIQVIDTASGPSANTDGDNQKKYSSPPPSICSPSSSSNGANFLLSSNIAPNNPFLRATSFHQNSSLSSSTSAATTNCADGDASDSSSTESQIIFAPPKLIPSSLGPNSTSSSSSGSFLQPSVLKTFDNSSSDIRKPNETISASKTFISLNKADIGKIKTPSFIKLSSPLSMTLSSANGSNMISSSLATSTNDETNKSVIKSPASTMMVDGGGSRAFLFGQKVEDRVVIDQSSDSVTNSQATAATSSSSLSFQTNASTTAAAAVSSSSSSSCLLSFSDVSNCEESTINTFTQQNPDDHPDSSTSFMSIMKNGADNNADSIFKRKYEVITGEEDEQNVLSIHGRLYAWDTDKATWVEKGRGPLHLNDVMKDEKLCSRLVMRTAGAYRLILNALIVAGMTFELASENCLRFTYIDGIYMIKANPKDIDQLHSAIEHRLREISKRMRSQDD